MVMQAYNQSTSGTLIGWVAGDSSPAVLQTVTATQKILDSILSARNVSPYTAYTRQAFRKLTMRKFPGWSAKYTPNFPNGIHWKGTSYDYPNWTVFDPLGTDRAGNTSDAYNRCLNSLNDTIRGNMDLSIDLLQGHQAFKMIRDVGKITRFALSLRRNPSKIVSAVRHLGWRGSVSGAGGTWLAVQYGIKPLMSSIYGLAMHTANHYNNEFAFSKAKGKSRSSRVDNNASFQWPDYTYTNRWEGNTTSRCEMGIVMRIPDNSLTNVARLTSLNPVSMAWELMPWSFVVDWFFNVGGYLRDLETALAYSSYFVRGYRTDTTLTEYEILAHRAISGVERYYGDWGLKMERKSKDRYVLSSYPMPARPIFKANLGSGRLLNAAGLLSQFLIPRTGKITARGGGSAIQRGSLGFSG